MLRTLISKINFGPTMIIFEFLPCSPRLSYLVPLVVLHKTSDAVKDSRESEEGGMRSTDDILARSVSERKLEGSSPVVGLDVDMVSTSGSSGVTRVSQRAYNGKPFILKTCSSGLDEEGTTVVSSSCTIEEGGSPVTIEVIEEPVVEPLSRPEGQVSGGWRKYLQSGQLASIGASLLAFSLTLSIWNFWRAVTYTLSPIPDMFYLRCILNSAVCLSAITVSLVCAYTAKDAANLSDAQRHIRVICNILGGIGLWELIESTISYFANSQPAIELIVYAVWLVVCIIIALVLHK